MKNYQRVIELSNKLIAAVEARNAIEMQQLFDDLELAYGEEFGDSLDCYEAVHAFALMNLAGARYFSFNNMFTHTHNRYEEMAYRMEGIERVSDYSEDQKNVLRKLFMDLEKVHKATPERHQNMVVGRNDTRCCLCRILPANKTGSHMVPNFLTHPTLSWDGKGKRYHEALNHDFLNEMERNCSFYGRDVPEWRFAIGNGITEVTKVSRENLNDWHIAEKEIGVDRRWFWNVRDWFVESSYDYYDPIRERMLRTIREDERSEDKVVDAETKSKAIELAEMASGPQEKLLRLRKFERITCAWFRVMMAKENGEEYDPLQDEELFLNERDFDNYYHDLAALSRHEGKRRITLFPFYVEARMAIPDKHEWG